MGLFSRLTNKNNEIVVTTKEELKAALKAKKNIIIAKGEAAKNLQWRAKLSPAKAIALGTAIGVVAAGTVAATPASLAITVPALEVGLSADTISAISGGILALGLGATFVIAILKDYNVDFTGLGTDIRLNKK